MVRKYVMYKELLCTKYIFSHYIHIISHMYTNIIIEQYRTIQRYTGPYIAIQTYTGLYTAIHSCT